MREETYGYPIPNKINIASALASMHVVWRGIVILSRDIKYARVLSRMSGLYGRKYMLSISLVLRDFCKRGKQQWYIRLYHSTREMLPPLVFEQASLHSSA